MIEVAPNLYVGSQATYEAPALRAAWKFILAAKEPWHRGALGYVGRGAPKDSIEYLWAYRDGDLILNIVDVEDPKYIAKSMMDEAVKYGRDHMATGETVAVVCNQGRSRSTTIAMLIMAPSLSADFETAEDQFRAVYPDYAPANGVRSFAREHWTQYHG